MRRQRIKHPLLLEVTNDIYDSTIAGAGTFLPVPAVGAKKDFCEYKCNLGGVEYLRSHAWGVPNYPQTSRNRLYQTFMVLPANDDFTWRIGWDGAAAKHRGLWFDPGTSAFWFTVDGVATKIVMTTPYVGGNYYRCHMKIDYGFYGKTPASARHDIWFQDISASGAVEHQVQVGNYTAETFNNMVIGVTSLGGSDESIDFKLIEAGWDTNA